MGRQYFKADILYDNNMGYSDSETLYIMEDNTSDYMKVCTEDGSPVTLDGTDSYIDMLKHVLSLEDYEGCGESVKITEQDFSRNFEIPHKVLKYFWPHDYHN